MHSIFKWISQYRLPILSGILIGTSYIPFPPHTLFFCLVPLLIYCLEHPRPRQVWIAGWITQFLLTLIGFHWVGHTAHAFGHMPWVLSLPILFAFCSLAHLHIPIAAWLWSQIYRRLELSRGQSLALLVALFSLCEYYFPAIFPWNFGYPWFWNQLGGYHWADVIGFAGLSSLTFVINALIAMAWVKRHNLRLAGAWVAAAIVMVIVLNWSGWRHGEIWQHTDTTLKLTAVQPNIGNLEKEYAQHGQGYQTWILERQIALSESALVHDPDSRLVIWPETAYPDYLEPDVRRPDMAATLTTYIHNANVALLTGAYSIDKMSNREYNGLFLINRQGEMMAPPYRKSILLAFGEYFPFGDWFPILYRLVPVVSNFGRGSGPTILDFEGVKIGPQICYEGLYPEFSAKLAELGAEMIVNTTNDSWFGSTFEPLQHLYMTLGRGIETRRPVIRVTNTGISTAMLASGEVLEHSPLEHEWTHTYAIHYLSHPPLTFFSQHHQWYPFFWLAFITLILILRLTRRLRSSAYDKSR
jgi:apolipoprotein N-acyltransferase